MAKTLYLQCDDGISGDMVVGALLDLGASEQGLKDALDKLGLEGYEIRITRKKARTLDACDFDVVMDADHENHDHDMAWLFGEDEEHEHGHGHGHGHHHKHGHHHHHDHDHDHVHEHEHHFHDHGHGHHHHHDDHDHVHDDAHEHGHHHHHHDHVHRNLADIRAIIDHADLSDKTKARATRIFEVIAQAEAKSHGATIDTVHFHEVGAVDSIVDVVAAAWCMDNLDIDEVVVSPLAEGEGHVRCAHGVLPIPVPAVSHIVEEHGLVLRAAHRKGELVTPTGAAIAAATRTRSSLPEQYRILATGMGTGKRAYNPPSVLRAMLIEEVEQSNTPEIFSADSAPRIWKLETEVDDCTGEMLGYVLDKLYEHGAREAHFIPVFMKKSRPGYQIEVLCDERDIPRIEQTLFEDTTTIGIRRMPLSRTALVRDLLEVKTSLGPVKVKRVQLSNGSMRTYPEYESVASIARSQQLPIVDVMRIVDSEL